MKKLIIGCGYVGRRLAERWSAQGDQVFAATRKPERAAEFARLGWRPIVYDINDPHSIYIPSVDLIFFAVGFDRSSGRSMHQVYVAGLTNVLEKLPLVGRFIYVSSSSVYGQTAGEEVDEDAETTPQESSGQVVLEAERILRQRYPQAIILRFAGIYGPGRLLREQALRAGQPILASADRWLNLIQVDDGVQAILAAEAQGVPGRIYNVADDEPVARFAFYELLAELLEAPLPRFVRPVGEALPPHEQTHRRVSNKRMRSELGVKLAYPSYRDGLVASVGKDSWSARPQ
ncbi:MAG TPA: SDR family oxidoreductase [Gemmataceae bacterium]|jgi:nucleoside-diphosphate-sugar epimerase|nr:SDR family oxidoreductase [Gemmataceae bacterium]